MEKVINKILVVKIGTSTLMKKSPTGTEMLDRQSFRQLGRQVLSLQASGYSVVLVSSAAITAGMVEAGVGLRPKKETDMPELQRLASIGWRQILNAWSEALPGVCVGELLLTRHELDLKSEREEALKVIHTLLKHGDIVIANENDAITHDEIAFGDNDTLSAALASQIGRSKLFGNDIYLILLSDIKGLYADRNDPTTLIKKVGDLSQYRPLAGNEGSSGGTGGMVTKFSAAEIASRGGVEMWIADGREENVLKCTLQGHSGTHFKLLGIKKNFY